MRDTGDDRKILQPSHVTQVISLALKFPNVKHVLDVGYKSEERKVNRVFKHEQLCMRKCMVSDTSATGQTGSGFLRFYVPMLSKSLKNMCAWGHLGGLVG